MYIRIDSRVLELARAPTELGYGEILLFSQIVSLSEKGKFFMTNKAIADLFCTSERTVKRWIANLKSKGLIDIFYEDIDGYEKRVMVSKMALKG